MDYEEFAMRMDAMKNKLYRTAYLYTHQLEQAQDAVSETAYRGLKSLHRLRQPEYFETWIIRILINICKNEVRRRKKELLLEEYSEDAMDALLSSGNTHQNNPLDQLVLRDAVFCLPSIYKEVIILRYLSGYSLEETASILRLPRGTVATRQRKALSLLRLDLGKEDHHEQNGRI